MPYQEVRDFHGRKFFLGVDNVLDQIKKKQKNVRWQDRKLWLTPEFSFAHDPQRMPFEILERIGSVAYKLALPPSLSSVHDVFHVSMLRKYISDPNARDRLQTPRDRGKLKLSGEID